MEAAESEEEECVVVAERTRRRSEGVAEDSVASVEEDVVTLVSETLAVAGPKSKGSDEANAKQQALARGKEKINDRLMQLRNNRINPSIIAECQE